MALMAALESDLRSLSTEARRRYPRVKDGAEHAILKLRSLSTPEEIIRNEDILHIFLLACEVKSIKLSVIGLSSLQKLISHDAVASSALKHILFTLKEHNEIIDESVQLKTLQTVLIIFQSHLHPSNKESMAQALGISLYLLEGSRSSDSVRNTAAATFRQSVALIFDHIVAMEKLPSTFMDDQNSHILTEGPTQMSNTLTIFGDCGIHLLEDLVTFAAGGSGVLLHAIRRTFALDILEFILSNYIAVFRILIPYQQVLRHQICSLLMTSIRINTSFDEEVSEPSFRRLVLRSVSHIIRHYNFLLMTECEVFLSMLVKIIRLRLPLWHHILVLENLRGFCLEARTLRMLFNNFDLNPKNTNVVKEMMEALTGVVLSIQFQDQETSEESLAAVAGMFSSKAKGIEWSLDMDASNTAVLAASEAHAITLAIEGILGVVFTISTLTDEAVDVGELNSPRCDNIEAVKFTGKTALLCVSMVDSLWLLILDALSLILTRLHGEAIILEILKGYQAFAQTCGVLHAKEPLYSFLSSLCKFTVNTSWESEKKSVIYSPGSRRTETFLDQRENIFLTPKNVQALRTLFNIAHRLHNVLGHSWVLVLETLADLDRIIHSPHASTQEISAIVPKISAESSGQYSDFNILSSLDCQLFESSGLMNISAVKSLLSALHLLSLQSLTGIASNHGLTSTHKVGNVGFAVKRMISVLDSNLYRIGPLWDQIVVPFVELTGSSIQSVRSIGLDALDHSICAVLGSVQFEKHNELLLSLERSVISPLCDLYLKALNSDVLVGSLKILLHVLERHVEKLHYSWSDILEVLRSVVVASEKELISLGFQSFRVIINDGISFIPRHFLQVCIDVAGSYCHQKTELNISLTAIGLLWTTADFIARDLLQNNTLDDEIVGNPSDSVDPIIQTTNQMTSLMTGIDWNDLLFSIFSLLQNLGADDRPEVRNSAVRTLFQTICTHGQKLSNLTWEDCLQKYVFSALTRTTDMVETSSRDEWQGRELGTRDGKAVHMLIHHSRNTVQKQWDETLVLVFGGISRVLRSFFPFLTTLNNFWSSWESLVASVESSISRGSKEVSLAALNCLQTTVVSHSPKRNLSPPYLISVFRVYEILLQKSKSNFSVDKRVKKEIVLALGELYVQTQYMFDFEMYLRLLSIIHSTAKEATSNDTFEADIGHISPVHRAVLFILPQLCPTEKLSSMWTPFLREILNFLPTSDNPKISDGVSMDGRIKDSAEITRFEVLNGHVPSAMMKDEASEIEYPCLGFTEKCLPLIVELFSQAPPVEKLNIFPEIIQVLRRCMTMRRDHPNGAIWRLAVEGFHKIVVDNVMKTSVSGHDISARKSAKLRVWNEIADVYEIFLVGYCGRALHHTSLPPETLKEDEHFEMKILENLGDNIMKRPSDAPSDILQRLVLTLDRCASRMSALPIETVQLMPSHCSRFSLSCLQKLFLLSSFEERGDEGEEEWKQAEEVGKICIMVLISRCDNILKKWVADENDCGDRGMPLTRLDEMVFVLQQLARLLVHPHAISVLPIHPALKAGLRPDAAKERRPHLLLLYPSLCCLVLSREARVRELVQVLLRLISSELALEDLHLSP